MIAPNVLLILIALAGIGVLVTLVTAVRLNPFLALLAAGLFVGAGALLVNAISNQPSLHKSMLVILQAFQDGLGATLAGTAAVIGLGTMLGTLLAQSRGAEVLAQRFAAFFGPERISWCIMALAMVVGLTTWFAVGLILLTPILNTLARETKKPFLQLALPMLAFLSVMHGLMPPHPGPVVAINLLHANAGMVLIWGFVVGIPTAAVAGPIFARLACRRLNVTGAVGEAAPLHPGARFPGFGLTFFSMLLPVGLMLVATVADLTLEKGRAREIADFIGNPTMALFIAVLFAHWSLGLNCGLTLKQLLRFSESAIAGVGMTILIVGGGGGFARVLKEAGVADALGAMASAAHLSPLLYGWMVSAFIRVATGSATVAITSASALMVPVLAQNPGTNTELAICAIGCGSLFLSHLNDGGFWIVKDCLNLTVAQTFRTWTWCETLVGLVGLMVTLLANALLIKFR